MHNKPMSRSTMLNMTLVIEAVILLLGTIWSLIVPNIHLVDAFRFNYKLLLMGLAGGAAMSAFSFLLYWLSRYVPFLRQMRDIAHSLLLPLVAELRPLDIIAIAVVSGFCEEVFFRGVVQPQFGIVITSIAFGLFHDPSFKYITYAIVAFLFSLLLGYLYILSGSLWVPIAAHFLHNLISLFVLRYWIKPPATPVGQG